MIASRNGSPLQVSVARLPGDRSCRSRRGGPPGRSAAGAVDREAADPGRRQVRLIFSALMLGMLLGALDQTIVRLIPGITSLAVEPRTSTNRISR